MTLARSRIVCSSPEYFFCATTRSRPIRDDVLRDFGRERRPRIICWPSLANFHPSKRQRGRAFHRRLLSRRFVPHAEILHRRRKVRARRHSGAFSDGVTEAMDPKEDFLDTSVGALLTGQTTSARRTAKAAARSRGKFLAWRQPGRRSNLIAVCAIAPLQHQ